MNKPTTPSRKDMKELITLFLFEQYGGNYAQAEIQEVKEALQEAYIAKFKNYMTDCPGYVGELFLVCFKGGPSIYTAVTRNSQTKQLELVQSDWSIVG